MELHEIISFMLAMLLYGMIWFGFGFSIAMCVRTTKEKPELNPVKAIKEHKDKKLDEVRAKQSREKAEAEMKRLDVIMRNIEAYDGTANGQEDVPRG